MLDRFHAPPTCFDVHSDALGSPSVSALTLSWREPDQIAVQSHANENDAIEAGAYAVAFVTVLESGFVVQRRAHHGSGADYLLSRRGEPGNDYIRLEVSGVARGDRLDSRLRTKVAQLQRGNLGRPGLALVVGFERARVSMQEVEE